MGNIGVILEKNCEKTGWLGRRMRNFWNNFESIILRNLKTVLKKINNFFRVFR